MTQTPDNELFDELENNQDAIISPRENDELIIEIDEVKPVSKPIVTQEPEIKVEQKAVPKPYAKVKAKKHKEKKYIEKEKNTGEKKRSKIGLIILIFSLLIVGAAGYLYVFQKPLIAKHIPLLVERGIIVLEDAIKKPIQDSLLVSKKESPKVTEKQVASEIIANEAAQVEEAKEVAPVAVVEESKSAPSQPSGRIKNIKIPSWIIGVSSVSNEAIAISRVAELSNSGYRCGYYWIPDYVSSGPKLFKVYVGWYNTKAEALQKLTQVRTVVPDAYVLELK